MENYEHDYEQHHNEDIQTTDDANRRLRALNHWLLELEDVRAVAAKEHDRIKARLEGEVQQIQKHIDWCEMTLKRFLDGTGKKSMSLPYGKLQRRAGRERIDVVLEETFVDWATKSGKEWLLRSRTTVRPDKIAIKHFVENTGEMPPGIELTKNEESFSAKPDPNACRDENPDT